MYGWAISQTLSVSSFKWVEDTFKFNKDFIKNYNEDSDKEYIFEVKLCINLQYPDKLH